MFGKDARCRKRRISYRVQSKVGQKTAMQGRDQTYMLPPLVGADPVAGAGRRRRTFATPRPKPSRHRSPRVPRQPVHGRSAACCSSLAGLRRAADAGPPVPALSRKPAAAAERLIGDAAILRGVGARAARGAARARKRRLDVRAGGRALGRAAHRGDLRTRAAAGVASAGQPHRVAGGHQTAPDRGRLDQRQGLAAAARANASRSPARPRRRPLARRDQARHDQRARPGELESIEEALTTFTRRNTDGRRRQRRRTRRASLRQALATAAQLLRRMKLEQTWFMKRLARRRASRRWTTARGPDNPGPGRRPGRDLRVAQHARRGSAVHAPRRRDHRDGRADRPGDAVLVVRALTRNKAGRTQVALPAVLDWSGGSWTSIVRHGALILFLAGLPFFVLALADPVFVADARAGQLSRPPHRADDRRLVEHDGALPGRAPERQGAERGDVLHHRRRGRDVHPPADERQISRPHRPDRIRRRGLRRHAVHERLRQHPAQPVADRRLDRVHEVPRSGNDDRDGDRAGHPACSRRSIFSTRPAT